MSRVLVRLLLFCILAAAAQVAGIGAGRPASPRDDGVPSQGLRGDDLADAPRGDECAAPKGVADAPRGDECAARKGVADAPEGDEHAAPTGRENALRGDECAAPKGVAGAPRGDACAAPKGRQRVAQGGAPRPAAAGRRRGALGSTDHPGRWSPEGATQSLRTVSRAPVLCTYDLVYLSYDYLYDARGIPRIEHIEGGEFRYDGAGTRMWRVIFHYDRDAVGSPTRIVVIYEYGDALAVLPTTTKTAAARLAALVVSVVGDYDPLVGRFVQRDPIDDNVPDHAYDYGLSSPLHFTDPTGEDVDVHLSVAVVAGSTFDDFPAGPKDAGGGATNPLAGPRAIQAAKSILRALQFWQFAGDPTNLDFHRPTF